MITLIRYLRSIQPLSEPLRDHLEDILKHRQFAPKEYLLKAGEVCSNIYFVESGLLRTFYTLGGKEISSGFTKEGGLCVSFQSFFSQQYGIENIQALEASVVWYLTYGELQDMLAKFPEFNAAARVLMEQCHALQEERFAAMWMQSAKDKYDWFYQKFPGLPNRVPAKHIASYLGITEVMLCKLKSRR